jgi:hypothetical protein
VILFKMIGLDEKGVPFSGSQPGEEPAFGNPRVWTQGVSRKKGRGSDMPPTEGQD